MRDTLITLQRYSATLDAVGEEVKTWTTIGGEWAKIYYGRGNERREAAQQRGELPATFNLHNNALTRSLRVRDRIVLNGANWDIQSAAPINAFDVEVTAIRTAN